MLQRRGTHSRRQQFSNVALSGGCHLLVSAASRRLFRTPAQELRPVTKAAAGKMVVANFAHQLRLQPLPFATAFRAPAARPAGRVAGESRATHVWLQERLEFLALRRREARREPYVIQQPVLVVKPEQKRANLASLAGITESAHHAIGSADALDLAHRRALAGSIWAVDLLGDHAIEAAGRQLRHPALRRLVLPRCRRQPDRRLLAKALHQPLQV